MAKLTRRALLISGGAAATLIAGAGFAGWYPGTASATAPWREAGQGFDDPRLSALSYAILAPNPHNMQPWRFSLTGSDGIDVFCALDRRLPETDPFDRQIVIGFGCMLETLSIAAAQGGYRAEIRLFPDGEPQPRLARRLASVRLVRDPTVVHDPLFAAIATRRTSREPYLETPIHPAAIERIVSAGQVDGLTADATLDAQAIASIGAIADRAFKIEYRHPPTRRESIRVTRIGNRAISDAPDGIALPGIAMGLLGIAGIVDAESLDTPGTTAFDSGLSMYSAAIASARGMIWLVSEGNARVAQLASGRLWMRMCLAAAAQGVNVHPLSQALQEFPEMAGPYRDISELLGGEGRTVQMLARIGHSPSGLHAPRWPLESRLISL